LDYCFSWTAAASAGGIREITAGSSSFFMTTNESSPKRPRARRLAAIIVAGLLLLMVAGYFVVTSGAFFKSVILPRVSDSVNADITVQDAVIRPFSRIELRGLNVRPRGRENLLEADLVRVRPELLKIIRGNLVVHEIELVSPRIHVIEQADGTSNLDPLTEPAPEEPARERRPAEPRREPVPPRPADPEPPPRIDLGRLAISDGLLIRTKHFPEGGTQRIEVSGLQVTITNLKNGATGRFTMSSQLALDHSAPETNSQVHATLGADLAFTLADDLSPEALQGGGRMLVQRASGLAGDLAGLQATLDCDMTPAEIRQIALRFEREAAPLGEIRASGPFSAATQEGELQIEIRSIDRQVLNLAGAAYGLDFEETLINSTHDIRLSDQGQVIDAKGNLTVASLSVSRDGQRSPTLDVQANYDVLLNQGEQSAILRQLALRGTQDQRPLLSAGLNQPMNLSWGGATNEIPDAELRFQVQELDLADWRPFIGDLASAGVIDALGEIGSHEFGQVVTFNLSSRIEGLTVGAGEEEVNVGSGTLLVRGTASEMKRVQLAEARVNLLKEGAQALAISASGDYNIDTEEADLTIAVESNLANLAPPDPESSIQVARGVAQLNARVRQTQEGVQEIAGTFTLSDFTGRYDDVVLEQWAASAELDLLKRGSLVQIRKANSRLQVQGERAGDLDVAGEYDLEAERGRLTLSLAGVNQLALRPFVPPGETEMQLLSGMVRGDLQAVYQADGASDIRGDVRLADFRFQDRDESFPAVPFSADIRIEAASANEIHELRQFAGSIIQGSQPAGRFEITGRYDSINETGQASLQITGLNEAALRPLLAPALGERTLVSVSVNAGGSARYDARAESAFAGRFTITNLVVAAPDAEPSPPLSLEIELDAGMRENLINLRQLELALAPTERAQNRLLLSGQLDLSEENARRGDLRLIAESLDLTEYYNLYVSPDPVEEPPLEPGAGPGPEPEPTDLGVAHLALETKIGRLHLREISITNFQTTINVRSNTVHVDPARFALNGAPVEALIELDLGVPGYRYNIQASADRVPLEPLANSFMPEQRGQYQGDLIASLNFQGVGTTGPSMREHLRGQFDLSFTNANIQIVGKRIRPFLGAIAAVINVPELVESPLNSMSIAGRIGNGRIDISQLNLVSEIFVAETQGQALIADELMESTIDRWPVTLSLRRSLAQRARLAPSDVPPDVAYVRLPNFIRAVGTLDSPRPEIDKTGLAGALLERFGAKIPGLDERTGGLLQGLGEVLSGRRGDTNQPPATPDQPAPPPVDGQAPPPAQPPQTNQPTQLDQIFDLFKRPKK
jgi:uncharacterized protein involved in outer membrane biogenesis